MAPTAIARVVFRGPWTSANSPLSHGFQVELLASSWDGSLSVFAQLLYPIYGLVGRPVHLLQGAWTHESKLCLEAFLHLPFSKSSE